MSWTLVVRDHGRWDYLERCLASLDPLFESMADRDTGFDRCFLSLDGVSMPLPSFCSDWEYVRTPERRGLAANLQQAWDALGPDEWVADIEGDFVIHDFPVDDMRAVLEQNPRVANMVLVRQPVSPVEKARGVLEAQPGTFTFHDGWIEHLNGFWLNPSVFHSSTVKAYDAAVESTLTAKMIADGLSFGYWGGFGDEPRCTHIGDEGGMGSPGWKP